MSLSRRVHVSQSTYEQLGDAFDVEPGNGGSRDAYLEERNIKTYFIAEKVHRIAETSQWLYVIHNYNNHKRYAGNPIPLICETWPSEI